MQNIIYPCLWFDGQAQEAAKYYCAIFNDSEIIADNPMVVTFRLLDQRYMALNGGPQFKFNESVSFVVNCADQQEIDYYWNALTEDGGEESMCGWLKDKYGLSWQIIPYNIAELLGGSNAQAAMTRMLDMNKIDIQALRDA